MCTWKKTKTETDINSLRRTTIWSWLIQIQDSEANEILFRMSAYGCLKTMLKSNSYTLKVSAHANRNVCVRKSRQNRVCIGVHTSFCEENRRYESVRYENFHCSLLAGGLTPDASQKVRGRGTPGNYCWGCAARFSKSWPYFGPKNVIFHTRFQTWPLGNYFTIT